MGAPARVGILFSYTQPIAGRARAGPAMNWTFCSPTTRRTERDRSRPEVLPRSRNFQFFCEAAKGRSPTGVLRRCTRAPAIRAGPTAVSGSPPFGSWHFSELSYVASDFSRTTQSPYVASVFSRTTQSPPEGGPRAEVKISLEAGSQCRGGALSGSASGPSSANPPRINPPQPPMMMHSVAGSGPRFSAYARSAARAPLNNAANP